MAREHLRMALQTGNHTVKGQNLMAKLTNGAKRAVRQRRTSIRAHVRQAEVGDFDTHRLGALHQHVHGAKVAMVHTARVQVLQATATLQNNLQNSIQRQRLQ